MLSVRFRQLAAAALLLSLTFTFLGALLGRIGIPARAAQEASPMAATSCDAATPAAHEGMDMSGMDMGSPMAGMDMDMEMELDQLYIDMMIPHHASIVALARVAQGELTDERLLEIAQNIIDTQSAEIEELRGYREQFYGSPDLMPMDTHAMEMMMQAMPGMGTMEEMTFQMDAAAQVSAFCAAEDKDLAFIDMTIAHHRMAIVSSEPVVEGATHEEIREFAQRVIADQQREIDELTAIRGELTSADAPTGSPAAGVSLLTARIR
jgi:uncharacterized protein (DUF305 family)